MAKLVPYWGLSAQPGNMYYLQKLHGLGDVRSWLKDMPRSRHFRKRLVSQSRNLQSLPPTQLKRVSYSPHRGEKHPVSWADRMSDGELEDEPIDYTRDINWLDSDPEDKKLLKVSEKTKTFGEVHL